MKVDIKEIDSCKKQFTVEVSQDVLNSEIDKAYESLKKKASIRGFRKGKVPKPILEKHYSKSVQQDVLQKIIPETYKKVIEENNIRAVGQPVVEDIKIDEESPLLFTATVQIIPDITLKPYTGLSFAKEIRKVTDNDVEKELNNFQERFAEFDSVDDKPVENSDYVIMDIESQEHHISDQGKVIKNHPVIVGSRSLLPEIEEGIIGMNKGEKKEIAVTFPDNYTDKNLAGNTVTFTVTINEIKKKRLKDIDDTFAKEIRQCDTVDELKKKIKQELEEAEQSHSEATLKKEVIKKLIEENVFDVPPVLVETQMGLIREEAKRRSAQMGQTFDPATYQHDEKVKEMASHTVKEDILLDLIAEAEQTEVTEEEVDTYITAFASRNNTNSQTIKKNMKENGSIDSLRSRLKKDKALTFLVEERLKIEDIFVER